jgi:hypothetical protein
MFVYCLLKLQQTHISYLLEIFLALHLTKHILIMYLVIFSCGLGFSTWQHAILVN